MHFNDLIIRYRLQLMGGTGAIGAIGFFLIQRDNINGPERRFYRMLLSALITILVIAAAVLDLLYYNRLLEGAVNTILEFEKNNKYINMSRHIHNNVHLYLPEVLIFWYGSIIVPLFSFTIWAFCRYTKLPKSGSQ